LQKLVELTEPLASSRKLPEVLKNLTEALAEVSGLAISGSAKVKKIG
jgi:hypothetical protein